jgi:tetratricopeptide (TPR) repeat protein
MDIKRPLFRLTIIYAGSLLIFGCHNKAEHQQSATSQSATIADTPAPTLADHLASARRMLLVRDWEAAAEAANKALLLDPENADATLIASEAEAGRGNLEVAEELSASIDIRSRLGKRAVELRQQQLAKLKRTSAAADVILAALKVMPETTDWRHRAWELLNRVGRREEASWQAETLCRSGEATQQELLSLIRRTLSFPLEPKDGDDPAKYFQHGLGMARWYFTQEDYRKALDELSSQTTSGFESAAACALYGRLLAETQNFEQFPDWHAKCDPQVRELGDYWAALGVYFYDQRRIEASARAFLEAVFRNPTDRVCFQRLSMVFGSLDRKDEAEQFGFRAIQITQTETAAEEILESPSDRSLQMSLVEKLVLLDRPFETLQWTQLMTGPAATSKRVAIERQRAELNRNRKALQMASESSLIGVSLSDFSLEPAMELLRTPSDSGSDPKQVSVDILARPKLVNVASKVGINFQWHRNVEFDLSLIPIDESVGGGIAVLDYDLDGWPDVYFAQGSGDPPTNQCTRTNVLVRNLSGQFAETTTDAGVEDYNYSSGLAAGDVNQDGFPDLLLGSLGHNRLLINNGDGTFTDATERLGRFEDRFTSSLAIADLNGDTLPDLFETNYLEMEGGFVMPEMGADGKPVLPGPRGHYAGLDRWFENLGNGSFRIDEISREIAKPGTSLGIVVTDFDSDGSNDIFVGNDMRPNHLLLHMGENQLANMADAKGISHGFTGLANGCMGISAADFNRDGLIDLHITNYTKESANLYIQTAGGLFADAAIRYGIDKVTEPMVGFGTKAVDIDRNGWLDLIITNGHIFDTRIYGEEYFQMPPQLMMSQGRRFQLTEVDDPSGYWEDIYLGRSMASLDFDRDGSIDFLIGHLDKPVALLHNQTETEGHWIQLELVGTATERDAIGARIVVTAGEEQLTQWVTAGDGYFCSDEPVLDFGLGIDRQVSRVEVYWPKGEKQTFDDLHEGHRYLIIEGEAEAIRRW